MEIDKITFESLRHLGITRSFEDLDVNSDGIINESDELSTNNTDVKNIISNLLKCDDEEEIILLDDEPTLTKAGGHKNKYGINDTNSEVFSDDIEKSKGTVYLVMGNLTSCGRCINLEKQMVSRLDELEANSQVFNIDWGKNSDKCWSLYKELAGKNVNRAEFPIVIKFVDGKPVELISSGSANYSNVVQQMIDKAEGQKEAKDSSEAQETACSDTLTSSVTSETKKEDSATTKPTTINFTEIQEHFEKIYKQYSTEMKKLQSEYTDIMTQKQKKQDEQAELSKKIEEKQKEYEKIAKKIENAEEGEDVSSLKKEAAELQSAIKSFGAEIQTINTTLNLLDTKATSTLQSIYSLNISMENANTTLHNAFNDIQDTTADTTADATAQTAPVTTTTDDGTDWSALSISGKGININNFVNLLDSSGDKKVTKAEIQNLYDKGTDEQKAVLKKFFDFNDKGKLTSNSSYVNYFTHLVKEKTQYNPLFEALAFQDTDGDGFLSDYEIGEIKGKINAQLNAQSKYGGKISTGLRPKTQCMLVQYDNSLGKGYTQLSNSSYAFTQTMVNGKKVFIGFTNARSQYLSITEDEMKILEQYMNPQNAKQYIGSNPEQLNPVWDALGAVEVKPNQTITLSNGQTYTNSGSNRPARVFVNSAGEVCSYMINEDCSQCGKSFYALYLGIKDMMEGKEVQFKRDASDMWV